ncbi:hypothetical protein [Corynebacterium sp. NML120713]|uniref:hypothetical protein n=1 Tax=Corynebacterium sp. NML120713 TaxID=1906332 RepID=UPI0008FAE3CD|nr:hypothetical protein [Corynebacterium sp. NML120713]OIR43740.1 hypothetical protein BJP06_04535 [Corynebacterium sp. NML120713]
MFHFLPLLAVLLDYFLEVPDTAPEPETLLASIISVYGPFSALVFGIAALLLRPLPRRFAVIASAGGLLGLTAIIMPTILAPSPESFMHVWIPLPAGLLLAGVYVLIISRIEQANPAFVLRQDTNRFSMPGAIAAAFLILTAGRFLTAHAWPYPEAILVGTVCTLATLAFYEMNWKFLVGAVVIIQTTQMLNSVLPFEAYMLYETCTAVKAACVLEIIRAGTREHLLKQKIRSEACAAAGK